MGALRRRGLFVGLLLVLVGGGVALWLNRDVARATVAARLAEALDARVRLGGLEIVAADHVVVHDLRIDRPERLPALRHARIDRIDVFGSLTEIRGGRIREVVATGSRVIVEPTEPLFATTAASAEVGLVIGRALASDVAARLAAIGEPPDASSARVDVLLHEVGDASRIAGSV
ncbi:MAG: hypothetical protein AAGE94_23705, partial [Acidobacteriota bacterium]